MYSAHHWTKEHIAALSEAQSFGDLAKVAITVLDSMPQPIGMVSGPISTGGAGSIAANLEKLNRAIDKLHAEGKNIFSTFPAQDHIFRAAGAREDTWTPELNQQLLDEFFLPLISHGAVKTFYFLPDWQSSHGATWEHEQAPKWGVKRIYLPDDFAE